LDLTARPASLLGAQPPWYVTQNHARLAEPRRGRLTQGVRRQHNLIHDKPVRPRSVSARAFALLTVIALQSTACGEEQPKPAGGLPPVANTGAKWYEIARTPEIVAYLDTARVEPLPDGSARIWFRFVYGTPMTIGADTSTKYAASEVREELDCGNRRTKDLELRMETTAGVSAASPVPNADWQSIDTHALNSGVFLVACRALGHPITARPGQTG